MVEVGTSYNPDILFRHTTTAYLDPVDPLQPLGNISMGLHRNSK
jgi:hypothetical protein